MAHSSQDGVNGGMDVSGKIGKRERNAGASHTFSSLVRNTQSAPPKSSQGDSEGQLYDPNWPICLEINLLSATFHKNLHSLLGVQ